MATTAGTLIDSIARRVRDPNNTAHSRAFVRDILDRIQVTVNAHKEYILTETIKIATPGQALYSVETDLGSSITVTDVLINGRELDQQTWTNLHRLNRNWLTAKSGKPFAWASIGRSLVAIYPAPDYKAEITFVASKITTPLSADEIPLELRKEDEDIVRDLTTAILLLRQRDLDTCPAIIQRAIGKLGLQMKEEEGNEE